MKNTRKSLLLRQILPVAAALLLHFLCYYVPKFLLAGKDMILLTTAWDDAIPFVPCFIVFYAGAFLQWAVYYLRLLFDRDARRYDFLAGEMLGKLIGAVLFVAWPITMTRGELPEQGVFAWALGIIYSADSPMCLFPSLHCLQSWMAMRYTLRAYPEKKLLCVSSVLFSIGVFASTVLVKQHLLPDVFAGILAAELCYRLAPKLGLPQGMEKLTRRIGGDE